MKEKKPAQATQLKETRREFLFRSAQGLGAMALTSFPVFGSRGGAAGLATGGEAAGSWQGIIPVPHFPPRAKRIIYLYMAGGPSHLESFDYKPKLVDMHGQTMPGSLVKGQQMSTMISGTRQTILAPLYPFSRYGKSGQEISSLFPHIGQIGDEICIIRSMQTDQINHDPAHTFMNTGSIIPGRPSLGSWLTYGLGSESENLPGFVVMTSQGGGQAQPIAARQWHSGFLPSRFQGVQFQSKGDPVHYVSSPAGVNREGQRQVVRSIQSLNTLADKVLDDAEITNRISQYEMAFRMQMSIPELVDLADEPSHIKEMYGTEGADGSFAANCLLARRMAERGVRFIQLYHRGWDHHGNLKKGLVTASSLTDRASAALVLDLKQRGLLEDTLLVWGGEFGRTPMGQGEDGRDHHIKCFSIWMAGAGIKPGFSFGRTDEFGYDVVDKPVHVHDLHATLLHIMGIDHKRLTYRHQGRDFRLTDVSGNVVSEILV